MESELTRDKLQVLATPGQGDDNRDLLIQLARELLEARSALAAIHDTLDFRAVEAEARAARFERELIEARATNAGLHRRAQDAESRALAADDVAADYRLTREKLEAEQVAWRAQRDRVVIYVRALHADVDPLAAALRDRDEARAEVARLREEL